MLVCLLCDLPWVLGWVKINKQVRPKVAQHSESSWLSFYELTRKLTINQILGESWCCSSFACLWKWGDYRRRTFIFIFLLISKPIRWDTPWRTRKTPPWSPFFLDLSQWPLSSMIMIMKQFFNVSRFYELFQQLGDWRHFQPILHTKRRSGIFKWHDLQRKVGKKLKEILIFACEGASTPW